MQAKHYPFGKPSKPLSKAVKWLNANQKAIKSGDMDYDAPEEFTHPEYWSMPTKTAHQLNTDEINFIRGETFSWWWPRYMNYIYECETIKL